MDPESGVVVQADNSGGCATGQVRADAGSGCLVNTRTKGRKAVLKSVEMCESGSHVLVLWDKLTGRPSMSPFRCNSWRCPRCQRFKGAQDFVRVRNAILKHGDSWVYLVLTMVPGEYFDDCAAYEAGYSNWKKLSKRLIRAFGPLSYVQTWEAHKSGFPHVNLVIQNRLITEACSGDGWRSWRQWLIPHLRACGFGRVVHVQALRSGTGAGLAGYLTKLSRELTGSTQPRSNH